MSIVLYDGVRRVSGLRREPVVSVENPTLIPTSHWKIWSWPCRGRPSYCEFCAVVLCTELATRGSESATTESGSTIQWDVGICVGCFTETKYSLLIPETRRNPSHGQSFFSVHLLFLFRLRRRVQVYCSRSMFTSMSNVLPEIFVGVPSSHSWGS